MTVDLSNKIKLSEEIIKKSYIENNGKIFISFSGGKDSTILRHIALRIFPDLKVVFSNTTNELREVIKYVKTFPNIITVKPKIGFEEVIKKHGFPLVSKEVSQKVNDLKRINTPRTRNTRMYGDEKGNGRLSTKWRFLAEEKFDVTPKCCNILKKDPLEKWAKENGGLKPIIALMSDESSLRKQLSLYGNSNKKIYPFLTTGWTEEDIWEYAKEFNIRFAECYYDKYINGKFIPKRSRTGCEYCGFGIHLESQNRFERSQLENPKKYERMMNLENNGVTFKTAIDKVKSVKDTPIKPELDIYGGELLKKDEKSNPKIVSYEWKHNCNLKRCPHCNSKNIKRGYDYIMNFFDSPFKDGRKRNIYVYNNDYEF